MRKGIGLIQAIMIILIVSGMMIMVLKYASISARHISDTYVKEQTALFLDSAIEQALLEISLYKRTNNNCLSSNMMPYSPSSITKKGITYSATVTVKKYYLLDPSDDLDYCTGSGNPLQDIGVGIAESTSNSHGMALFEVEAKATKTDGTVVSRILKRTLQQP